MAIKNTSILLLFLGAAALFLAVAETTLANRPITVGPVAVRPAPPVIKNVCKKVPYQHLCEVSVQHKNDPFKALISHINTKYILARQVKILYLEKMNNKYCMDEAEVMQEKQVLAKEALQAKNMFEARHQLEGRPYYECEEPDLDLPPPLDEMVPTLGHLTANSLALLDLVEARL